MSAIYVLLMVVSWGSGLTNVVAEFDGKDACEKALTHIQQQNVYLTIRASGCFRKG
jgi:hypothetical protein